MPRRAQPGTLRTLAKRALLCLLLGAVLQYFVAVGFGLGGSYGEYSGGWALVLKDHDVTLLFGHSKSMGREVLSGSWRETGFDQIRSPDYSKLDWSCGEWLNADASFEPMRLWIPQPPSPPPPRWPLVVRHRTRSDFDSYPSTPGASWLEVGCGWPMCSASYQAILDNRAGSFVVRRGAVIANATPWEYITPRVLPLGIYWPGAIINTFAYAAILLVPITLIPLTRHHLRRRAGRCTACGYDLRGVVHEVCPECGCTV